MSNFVEKVKDGFADQLGREGAKLVGDLGRGAVGLAALKAVGVLTTGTAGAVAGGAVGGPVGAVAGAKAGAGLGLSLF